MSKFKFSNRSLDRLIGVDDKLVSVITRALELSEIDFAITEGLRGTLRQKELVAQGASNTMNSKHLTGNAVDVVAFLGNRISWELPLYFKIADAVKAAAHEQGVVIRWGGAWHVNDIKSYGSDMKTAHLEYVDLRRSQGRNPFVDGPHFENAS
jgi:peptidoglycan LD-endopeptidase CwlK